MEFLIALVLFREFLVNEKYLSKNTVISYLRDNEYFCRFARLNNISTIKEINKNLINGFRVLLKRENSNARSIARKVSSLRAFFKFLRMKYDFEEITLTIPKFEAKLPDFFTREDILHILQEIEKDKSSVGIRNRLIFLVFYTTGIRNSEMCNIKISDFKFDDRLLLIHGKGNRQRFVPLIQPVTQDIQEYITITRPLLLKGYKTEYLFFTLYCKNPKPFTRQAIWSIFRQFSKKLKMEIYPHKLRHSIACHFLESGLNIRAIQKILGHENIITTAIYTQVTPSKLKDIYDKYHPRR